MPQGALHMEKTPLHDTTQQPEAEIPGGIPAPSGAANLIDTDYVVGQDNIKGRFLFNLDIHGKVFSISALTVVLFVVLALALQSEVEPLFGAMRDWLTANLAWFFLGSANIFVLLCLFLIVSPLGKVRLGGAAGNAQEAASLAMASTIFHWGLHPWAIYAIVALALALFSFNKGLPLSIRSIFYPILGERVWGWPGHIIDILAVFATLFGLATSLGLGAEQAAAGLDKLFGIAATDASKVLLIIGITAIALLSVLAGLDKGVKRLSELNMGLAILLLLFVIIAGPTLAILTGFFDNLGAYLQHLPALSNPIAREDANFSQEWPGPCS